MIKEIKQELIEILNEKNIEIEELEIPSKNNVFLVKTINKKFILKLYKFQDDRENIKSYNREKSAINYFSSHLNEVKPLIFSKDGDNPWILMDFFKGSSLKKTEDFDLYKKAISLMLKLHLLDTDNPDNSIRNLSKFSVSTIPEKSVTIKGIMDNGIKKPNEIEILGPYDKKLQEVKERVNKYLPKKYDKDFLIILVDNFYLCYKYIYDNSNNLIHGDFVDRNIFVNRELNLIDFENSRIAPLVEDLIFFIENSKLENSQKEELTNQYKKEIEFDEKMFLILTLLTKLRVLGSLLRIKQDKLEKFEERISSSIKEIKDLSFELKDKYDLNLVKKNKEDWNNIFSSKGTFFKEVHTDLKSFVKTLNKSDTILDLGSGSGRHIIYFADKGFNITGIDSAQKGIKITKKILNEKKLNAKLIYKNFYEELPFEDNSFDCIISTQAMHHNRLYEVKKLIDEIKRILKAEGKIFITVPKIKDISHKEPLEIEKNTFIPTKGHEQGVVHHYFDIPEIKKMFSDFEIEIKEDDYKHYLIVGKKKNIPEK